MTVSAAIGQEAGFLGISIVLGMGLFFLYDILRIFRRIVPHGNVWIGAEDFIYWLICTGAVFVMLYQENDGMVRGFALGGVIFGMLLYFGIFSRFVVRVNVLVLKTVLGVGKKITVFLFRPFYKVGKKILVFIRKQLKKFLRAVKIGLCKL
ncbi:MAG: spore cortex biosynthesis protein YabQ [Roseburia sp.]|nr:spore cortex biosynthesis protein YabQ [Roseburia sp.]